MPNLCGVNQKLLAEALSSVKRGMPLFLLFCPYASLFVKLLHAAIEHNIHTVMYEQRAIQNVSNLRDFNVILLSMETFLTQEAASHRLRQ